MMTTVKLINKSSDQVTCVCVCVCVCVCEESPEICSLHGFLVLNAELLTVVVILSSYPNFSVYDKVAYDPNAASLFL